MLKHYFKITYRNIKKHKASFLINIAGLSAGLACALLIFLWVNDELQFDKFHVNGERIYQVMETNKVENKILVHEETQGPLAASMKKDLPEVEKAVPVFSLSQQGLYFTLKNGDKSLKGAGIFAGNDLFSVFTYPLVEGNKTKALNEYNSIVISQKLADNFFGSAVNAMGKIIDWDITGMKKQSVVTGVFANMPNNSSMQFDFALNYDVLINELWTNGQTWTNEGPTTYLLLKPNTSIAAFDSKIKEYLKNYDKGTLFTLFTRKYTDAYLYGTYENGVQAGGRIEYVRLFTVIAIFILLIACINFMNLSTARASQRLKEVGIKKVVGSSRKALAFQFISEAVLLVSLSFAIAVVIVMLCLPAFNQLTGKELDIPFNMQFVLPALAVIIITGLIAGSYPALYLSGFNPVKVLKGRPKNSVGELLARKGLVVFQFTISLVLIVSVVVMYRQMQYIQNKNLGYNRDNIIYFDKQGTVAEHTETFIDEMKKIPGIVNVSSINQSVVKSGPANASTYGIDWPGKSKDAEVNFTVRGVDYNMLETLGIQIKEGRSFSAAYGGDSSKLIINETAAAVMGLAKPVGTKVKMWDQDMEIAGVVKDFNIASLHEKIQPMVFYYNPSRTFTIMAKIQAGHEKAVISQLQQLYKNFNPGYPFEYHFLDEFYQAQYASELIVSSLSKYFAALAILISCLGLFGLAIFNAETKTKEIGIRKVLGASVSGIMLLLTKDFFKLIFIAVCIAFPVAWWAMHNWLGGYAYKVNMGADVFVISFFTIVLFTLVTVSYQAVKAALMNPAKSLRTE